MDQKCLPSWRNPARYPTSPDADAFVHASHLMGGVHQRGGRRAAHRAAHRGAVGPERSGRSILKLTSLCRCAGPQEAAFCVLRAMRHRGCYGIGGRVFEHRGGSAWPGEKALRSQRRSAPTRTAHAAAAHKRSPARLRMMMSGPPLPTLALGRSAKRALQRASRAARSARRLRHPHHQEATCACIGVRAKMYAPGRVAPTP